MSCSAPVKIRTVFANTLRQTPELQIKSRARGIEVKNQKNRRVNEDIFAKLRRRRPVYGKSGLPIIHRG